MKRFQHQCVAVSMSLLLTVCIASCDNGTTADTDPQGATTADERDHTGDGGEEEHQKPNDLASAVTELHELYQAIKVAFNEGNVEQAHGPLHDIGGALEAIPNLAVAAGLSDDDTKAVVTAVAHLFEGYSDIDDALHAGKEADYQAVAATLDENMVVIEKIVSTTSKDQE